MLPLGAVESREQSTDFVVCYKGVLRRVLVQSLLVSSWLRPSMPLCAVASEQTSEHAASDAAAAGTPCYAIANTIAVMLTAVLIEVVAGGVMAVVVRPVSLMHRSQRQAHAVRIIADNLCWLAVMITVGRL